MFTNITIDCHSKDFWDELKEFIDALEKDTSLKKRRRLIKRKRLFKGIEKP